MYYPKSQIVPNLTTSGGELQSPDGTNYNGNYFKTSDGRFFTGKSPSDKPNRELFQKEPNRDFFLNSNISPNPSKQSQLLFDEESEPVSENMYIIDDGYYNSNPKLWDRGDAPRPPIFSTPLPQEKDYKNGYFIRYFLKKTNEYQFIEVSKKEYNFFESRDPKVEHNLYVSFTLKWKLKGVKDEVYKLNQTLVYLKERNRKLYGLSSYFQNKFDKYWVE